MPNKSKIDIWTPIISIVGVILIIFFSLNVITNKETKSKLKSSIESEIKLLKEIEKNSQKIDSLYIEILIRDSVLNETIFRNYTLEQIKQKYEKNYINVRTMPVDSSIEFFSKEIDNR